MPITNEERTTLEAEVALAAKIKATAEQRHLIAQRELDAAEAAFESAEGEWLEATARLAKAEAS